MEVPVVRSRGRPRKRRREDTEKTNVGVENGIGNSQEGNSRKKARPSKRRFIDIKGQVLVGRYVRKEFKGSGVFIGKIIGYDTGLYRVEYEDGDCEDFDSGDLSEYLIGNESEVFVDEFLERKEKLDRLVGNKTGGKLVDEVEKLDTIELTPKPNEREDEIAGRDSMKVVEVPKLNQVSDGEAVCDEVHGDDDDDYDDSSSDSCEYGQGWETRAETETPAFPPLELPPSSGNIGVPEECVSHLLSVYVFLRSFSIPLFLSPFRLDDLVGCLNSTVPSTLLNSIHVALLRVLRQHLETLASDGSELASKCLRSIDWSLLDMWTWPVYLVHYLTTMGHLDENDREEFYPNVLEKEYCILSVRIKLTVLKILCDDALDNAEIRAEIDMRERSEIGLDSDGFAFLENEPRKAYPRHSKIYVGKDRESANMDRQNALPLNPNIVAMESNNHKSDTVNVNVDEDGNVDECRLCGMDGMLLCCDGCPSAYHSRCIGVSKLSIPSGDWFCPECTIRKKGPTVTTGTSLRGAEIFGVDSYGQLFLGSCDHLLVLKVSVNTSPFVRYYNCTDIIKVVTVLCSTPHHAALYMGMCELILKYWGLPQSVIPPLINSQTSTALENRGETVLPAQVHPFGENGSHEVLHKVENGYYASGLCRSFVDNVSGSNNLKCSSSDVSLGVPMETDLASVVEISGATTQNPTNMISKLVEQAEPSRSVQGLADRSGIAGNISCISGNNSSSTAGHINGAPTPKYSNMNRKVETEAISALGLRTDKKGNSTYLFMGSLFKPFAYINHFVHGNFAASAAANFTDMLSDENRASELNAADPRKVMSAKVTLQLKAFTSEAVRFLWPSTEKKLVEVPRERCSWCLQCKASVGASRKACLLNQAALNATRAAVKFFSSCRMTKSVEGGLYSISIYVLYMEESLRGLILGPFKSEAYRLEWRNKVEKASTCSDMKSCLLELEGNLSTIALSSEWTKLVNNWTDESSVPQSVCPTGSTQKRVPGRRKKHLAAAEVINDDSDDKSNDMCWWRGGKLAKFVYKRATLPSSVLTKAARQGGSRRIPGIYYADSSDVPKRSRQFIWRAAVEMSRNASQLALQVRYMDQHIKWSDLVRPEQTVPEGKGSESEVSAFRHALVCDKKVVENKITYGVVFGNQKHLSSRLAKSIIEKEEDHDGKDKYWFTDTRVPLYLIKEYEEKAEKTLLLPPKDPLKEPPKGSLPMSKLQQKQVKAFRKKAVHYLACRRDNLSVCFCAACDHDVLLDFAATCSVCEGYCHKDCTLSSTVRADEDVKFVTICKLCFHGKAVTQNNSCVDSPTSPLAMQGQVYQNSATATKNVKSKSISQQLHNSATAPKITKLKIKNLQLPSLGTSETPSDKKPPSSGSCMTKNKKRPNHLGLIWKKKIDDDGSSFRCENIICRGNLHDKDAVRPDCFLCKKTYNPELMYICCEACHQWYHADAVKLVESKISNLLGFKCCRCRRIRSPICPYADPDVMNTTTVKKIVIRGPKEEAVPTVSVSEVMSEQTESVPSTPISAMEDDIFVEVDDPLLLSVSEVEQIPEPKPEVDIEWNAPSGPGPKKLPVRRQVKNQRDDDFTGNQSLVQCPTFVQTKDCIHSSIAEWDISNGGLEDGTTFDFDNINFENTDFEPQTYFSFTELLEADEGNNEFQGIDATGTCFDWPCENSSSGFFDQCEVGLGIDNVPTEPAGYLACNICSQTEPATDLHCQICGLQFHKHCSPWEEFSQGESWSCGNCRVWN